MKGNKNICQLKTCRNYQKYCRQHIGYSIPVKTEIPKEVRAQQIEHRLIEIRNMDKSSLSRAEKKELRKEVKSLKKEAATQGIYLSIGAIIIIILLLILLL